MIKVMKRLPIIFLSLLLLLHVKVFAQSEGLNVKRFEDVSTIKQYARTQPKFDNNGEHASLVLVQVLADVKVNFTGAYLLDGVEQKASEYWVYMAAGAKSLEVHCAGYEKLKINFADVSNGEINSLIKQCTYELVISVPTKEVVIVRDTVVIRDGEENDTITISAILDTIAVKSTTSQPSTQRSIYSSYPSQRTTHSYSLGSSSYSSEKKEPKVEKDLRIMYFGFGGAVGTTFSAHVSIFNIRYKRFEIRPCVWGVGGTIYAPIMHSKLPSALVHKEEQEDYVLDDSYNVARPSKGAQWFYTPTIRWHIPIREGWIYFVIGFGPQFSWTKTKWDIDYYPISWLDDYQYTTDPFPYDSYSYDGTWFTCEIALNWKFGEKMDFETFLRYQDGLVFGLECKFGNEYSSFKRHK